MECRDFASFEAGVVRDAVSPQLKFRDEVNIFNN